MRRRVRSTGDHAVGQPQVHHHCPEVRHVGDRVARLFNRDTLVRAKLRVLDGELLAKLRIERAQDVRGRDVEAEFGRALADLALIAEDREPGDLPSQQGARRPQDAVIRPLRQHDVALVRPGPIEQVVLEHERSDHV